MCFLTSDYANLNHNNNAEGTAESVLPKRRYSFSQFLVHIGIIVGGIVLVCYDSVITGCLPQSTMSEILVLVSSLLSASLPQIFYIFIVFKETFRISFMFTCQFYLWPYLDVKNCAIDMWPTCMMFLVAHHMNEPCTALCFLGDPFEQWGFADSDREVEPQSSAPTAGIFCIHPLQQM